MNGVIYIRVSTDDKDQNPERQTQPIERYFTEHNIKNIKTIEDYYTGNSDIFDRPQGRWLKKHFDKWDCIGVYDISRFSRQHPTKIFKYLDDFKNNGKKLISVTEPAFNMDSEFSEIITFLISWFNSYYLKQLKKNVKSGLDNARSKGIKLGRPILKEEIKNKIVELKAYGYTNNKIANQLSISPHSVKKYLQ